MNSESTGDPTKNRQVSRKYLKNLLLDPNNPRFGLQDKGQSQAQILDLIVEKFGVNDVLSSLAVNGYFEAEPLVCRSTSDSAKAIVVEGNRRLAACLIITGDDRAVNQATRTVEFQTLWKKSGSKPIDPVPAIVFGAEEQKKEILSYLGVRHIASSQPWDSYAKAAWVAQIVEQSGLTIDAVSQMIGDRHRTVNRLLEGYYLVQQLETEGQFTPQDSVRRGRGSVTEYPFSWVYTILGYKSVRQYLKLKDSGAAASPLDKDRTEQGGILLKTMFGDKSIGRNAAINDSREISNLASAFASPEKIHLLEQGKSLSEVETLTQPIDERLINGLNQVRDTLRILVSSLSEHELDQDAAIDLVPLSGGSRKLAIDLDKRLKGIAFGEDDE